MGIYIDAKYGPLKMNILGKNSLSAVNSMAGCQTFQFISVFQFITAVRNGVVVIS